MRKFVTFPLVGLLGLVMALGLVTGCWVAGRGGGLSYADS